MIGDEASVKDYLPKEKQFLITREHISKYCDRIFGGVI